jgi:tetratricopeptide (TPR) repeat protein
MELCLKLFSATNGDGCIETSCGEMKEGGPMTSPTPASSGFSLARILSIIREIVKLVGGHVHRMWRGLARSLRNLWRGLARSLRWLSANIVNKTITLVICGVIVALAFLMAGLILRFASPRTRITVSAFQVFGVGEKENDATGKVLADLIVDSLRQMLQQGAGFSGNAASSKKNLSEIPDMPEIPVERTYGLEIQGISLDKVLEIWTHIRYHEYQVSGDMLSTTGEMPVVILRYKTEGRGKKLDAHLTATDLATLEKTISGLTLELLEDINPQVAAQYLMAEANSCNFSGADCPTALRAAVDFSWKWTKNEPQNPKALYLLGRALADAGQSKEALFFLNQSLQLDPRSAKAWHSKGYALMVMGEACGARCAFLTSLSIKELPTTLLNLGILEGRRGRFQDAEVYHGEALSLDPEYVGALLSLGYDLFHLKRYREAAEKYRQAYMLDPGNDRALYGLVTSLAAAGQTDQAVQVCELAQWLDPNRGEPLVAEGAALLRNGETDEAIAKLMAGVDKSRSKSASILLGIAFFEKGDLAKAESKLREYLQTSSSLDFHGQLPVEIKARDAEAHLLLSRVLKAQGNLQESDKEAKESEREAPWLKHAALYLDLLDK